MPLETEAERWAHLAALDDEMLRGGLMLSEWCAFILREADTAFAKGAYLASILTTVAALETHLRSERESGRQRLVDLIDSFECSQDLRVDLHRLRTYRNRWVHVSEPENDTVILEHSRGFEDELLEMAVFGVKVLRCTLYSNQFV